MVGVFSAQAEFTGKPLARPERVVLQCNRPTWIADRGLSIRGYRTGAWRIVHEPGLTVCFSEDSSNPEGIVRHHCVASTVHLNFAAQPRVLGSFFAPHAPSLCI